MPEVHAEVRAVLDRVKKEAPDLRSSSLPFAESRALRRKNTPSWLRLPLREMAKVEDRTIPGPGGPIPIRICTPKGDAGGGRPVALFFHTGGFVFGDLDNDDPQCRRLADESGCIMVSVDYRLAPENKFPAAYEDAIAAWQWVVAHAREIGGDGERFAVTGGSAGGNLTANVCRYARDNGGPAIAFQLIFVGAFNVHPPVPSHVLHNMGGSGQAYANMVRDAYRSSPQDHDDVRYAPLIAASFSKLPPAMIVVADCDAFCDEGRLYAEKLRAAGVPVELIVAEGQIHQVFSWSGAFSEGPKLLDRAGAALRKAMAATPATAAS
jgi:acetyl esterase